MKIVSKHHSNIIVHIIGIFTSCYGIKMKKILVNRLPIWTFRCNQIIKYSLESLFPGFIFLEYKDGQLGVLKMDKFVSWKPLHNTLLSSFKRIMKQLQLYIVILTINCNRSSTNGSWTFSFTGAVLFLYPNCCLQYGPVSTVKMAKSFWSSTLHSQYISG